MSTTAQLPLTELVELERQTERGNFFAHSALGENLLRLAEVESFLHGLIDTLLAKGLVNETDLVSAIDKVRSELMQRNELSGTRTVVRADDQAEAKTPVKVA